MSERLEAAARGDIHYHGSSCVKCGSTLRYVTSGTCVACSSKASRESQSKLRKKIALLREQARSDQTADRGL